MGGPVEKWLDAATNAAEEAGVRATRLEYKRKGAGVAQ
jgi:hypothetical protein